MTNSLTGSKDRDEQTAAQDRECVVCGQPLTSEGKCPHPQETLCTMTDEGPLPDYMDRAYADWLAFLRDEITPEENVERFKARWDERFPPARHWLRRWLRV